ncbi:MAG: hypothetical protein JW783_00435 [Bacteroidales bacterium]|nr:hypothetical protein [Bacteroidales bacterium]MBN2748488.1 hypothetical protein [Bacteroidales bacterium]
MSRIVNIETLRKKKYDELDLGDFYNSLLGIIESKTSIFIYGTSGSGKSVFTLQFAANYADKVGKTLYNSHEESLKKSIHDRVVNFNIKAKKLYVGESVGFAEMVDKIKRNYYRMVVVDSVQYMNFTYAQQKELYATFKKRKIILVLVSFGSSYKKPACAIDIMHACDIKMFFDKGVVTVDSRYLSETRKTRIFTPRQSAVHVQGALF